MVLHLINSFPCITIVLLFSLIFLLESWLNPDSSFFTLLYLVIHTLFFVDSLWQKRQGECSSGLILYVHEDLKRVSIVQCKNRDDRVWIKVAKSISRQAWDLYISFFYVPPDGSTGFSSISTKWQNIDSECMQFSALGDILLLDAITGLLKDVPDDISARLSKDTLLIHMVVNYLIYVLDII